MSLQFITKGHDILGNFTLLIPGFCASCEKPTDVVLKYASPQSITRELKVRGIDSKSPFLVLKHTKEIGVTCGCYAKWHRQVAHISDKRNSRKSG